jgi:hypothetical protein
MISKASRHTDLYKLQKGLCICLGKLIGSIDTIALAPKPTLLDKYPYVSHIF